ncbi:MAG: sensor histidine kinase [Elainellaceae cyanobacterium]
MAQFFSLNHIRGLWSNLPNHRRRTIITTIPVICLTFGLGAWVVARQQAIEIHTNINQSKSVITETDRLLIDFLSAQTAIRGYYATQQPEFLTAYRQAIANFPSSIDQLDQLLETDPAQQTQLARLEGLVKRAIATSAENLERLDATAQNQASEQRDSIQQPSLDLVLSQNTELMRQIRDTLEQLNAEEQRALAQEQQDLQQIRRSTTLVIGIAIALGLVGSLAAIYLLERIERELQAGELQLRESQNHMQAIVDNVVDGILILDHRGRIETFNPGAAKMFGYQPDEVIGQPLRFLLEDPLVNEKGHGKTVYLDNNQVLLDHPHRTKGRRKVGASFPVEVTITDMQLDGRLIAIFRDVTERQRSETALQARANELVRLTATLAKTNEMLANRNRELDQFAYVASHDLKAPLRAIANLSEWIEEDLNGQLPNEVHHHMDLLRNRVHRMQALINGLLDYARVGRSTAPIEEVNTDALVRDVIDILDPPAEFEISITSEMPTFSARPVLLKQVFANLIGNAIKHHNRPDGRVEIAAKDKGQWYEFSVADDGPGIPHEQHEKVFTIFQVLKPEKRAESTGIGLSVVKKIVESEGGNIWLKSEPGSGTVFSFTWPNSK